MAGFTINGRSVEVDAAPRAPLLWLIRERLKLMGARFGCGAGQCRACTVPVDGKANCSCLLAVAGAEGRELTTIVGPAPNPDHPLQRAWVEKEVPRCGYC